MHHSHKSHREAVGDAITGIKTLATHEERIEAYMLLNAEINARLLDQVEGVLDELEDMAERQLTENAETAASDT